MTEERLKVKRKIAALLALATRPGTEHEGEAALARAQHLAAKHGFRIRKAVPRQAPTDDWFFRYTRNTDRTAAEDDVRARQQTADDAWRRSRKRRTEARRKRTTYARAYERGFRAGADGKQIFDNPYDKHVWGVNLPQAWRRGWQDAVHGRQFDRTTPFDREAAL